MYAARKFGATSLGQETSRIIYANVALWWINRLLSDVSIYTQKSKTRVCHFELPGRLGVACLHEGVHGGSRQEDGPKGATATARVMD